MSKVICNFVCQNFIPGKYNHYYDFEIYDNDEKVCDGSVTVGIVDFCFRNMNEKYIDKLNLILTDKILCANFQELFIKPFLYFQIETDYKEVFDANQIVIFPKNDPTDHFILYYPLDEDSREKIRRISLKCFDVEDGIEIVNDTIADMKTINCDEFFED